MQFPNCSAKVIVFSVFANSPGKMRVFYNIVLDIKWYIYTYKQIYQLKTKKTNHRSTVALRWLSPLNTFKQNEI